MPETPDVSKPIGPGASKEEFDQRAPDIAAATLLRQLGYSVDAGGPLYYLSLAKFLQGATEEERKKADTPEGLLMVLHRRLDAKKNAEAEKEKISPLGWLGIGVGILGALWLAKQVDKE